MAQEIPDYLRSTHQQILGHLLATEPFGHHFHQPFVVLINRIIIVAEMYETVISLMERTRRFPLSADEAKSRIKYLFRDMLFVGSMSTMEYYLIQIFMNLPLHPAYAEIQKKHGPRNAGLPDFKPWLPNAALWDFAIQFRNDVVHYDAVARRTLPSPSQLDFPINMVADQQAEGVLRSFIALTKALELSYYNLVASLLPAS